MNFAERVAERKRMLEEGKELPALKTTEIVEDTPIAPTPKASEQATESPTPPVRRFGAGVKSSDSSPITLAVKEPEREGLEKYSLTNVMTMANIAGTKVGDAEVSEGELLVAGDIPEDAQRIKQRISLLESVEQGSMKSEMDELKKLIKASPEACQYLLPAEMGQMVRALRSMTDNKLAIDMKRAKPKKEPKVLEQVLSPQQMLAALDDL